jgi:hypothetical protein
MLETDGERFDNRSCRWVTVRDARKHMVSVKRHMIRFGDDNTLLCMTVPLCLVLVALSGRRFLFVEIVSVQNGASIVVF